MRILLLCLKAKIRMYSVKSYCHSLCFQMSLANGPSDILKVRLTLMCYLATLPVIRLKKEKMLQSFFIANTLTSSFTKQIYSFILGTTRMRISRNNLASIQIACPPIEEQKRFDDIYTQAKATKASLRASIEAINRVIRSLINQ